MTAAEWIGAALAPQDVLESVAAVLASLDAGQMAGAATDRLRDAADALAELARDTESAPLARALGEARTTLAVYLQAAHDVAEAGAQDRRRAELLERGRQLTHHQLEMVLTRRSQPVSS